MKPEAMLATSIKNAAIAYAKRATKTKATTVPCQYVGKDGEGKMWVLLPGATSPTPVRRASVEAAPGDTVSVTIGNGRAVIDSNISNPSAGTSSVARVEGKADTAQETADVASSYAKDAYDAAARAGESASVAQSKADEAAQGASVAQAKADEATGYAQEAQGQAGIAKEAADDAQESADTAYNAAQEAISDAADAASAASAAQSSADSAEQSAQAAQEGANKALYGVSLVEDVVGTLEWITEHGTYVRTQDTAIVEGKVYFTCDQQTGDYTPVIDPQVSQLSSYYELDLSDSQSEFILAHLAVTSRGLWVLPSGMGSASDAQHAPNYKVLLSSDGMYLYDGTGAQVVKYGTTIEFSTGRGFAIGDTTGTNYIAFVPGQGITIGGSVSIGSNKTLAELLADVDNTVIFKVTESYSQDGSTATLNAHVYKSGEDIASSYPDSCFAWYRKSEDGTPEVPLGNGRAMTVSRAAVGFGAAIKCCFTEPNDSELLTQDDDTLTGSDGTPLAARTPSGDYVRVADLETTTTVFDTDKLMLVGVEEEQLVSIATLKDVFGDGDYERLENRPSIEGVTLSGDKDFPDLGIFQTDSQGYDVPDDYTLSTLDINALWANAQPIGA